LPQAGQAGANLFAHHKTHQTQKKIPGPMKAAAVVAAVAVIALIALTLVPEAGAYRWQLSIAALALSVVVLGTIVAGRRPAAGPGSGTFPGQRVWKHAVRGFI